MGVPTFSCLDLLKMHVNMKYKGNTKRACVSMLGIKGVIFFGVCMCVCNNIKDRVGRSRQDLPWAHHNADISLNI